MEHQTSELDDGNISSMRRRLAELETKLHKHQGEAKTTATDAKEEVLATEVTIAKNRRNSGRRRAYVGAAIALLGLGYFLWPGPMLREQSRLEKMNAAIEEEAAKIRKRNARKAEIAAASDDELLAIVRDCKHEISTKIRQGSPFEVYFPDYGVADLKKFASYGTALGMKLGRPSTVLEGFDSEAFNVTRMRDDQVEEIKFAVESAMDSFGGVKRYAAVYVCHLIGMSIAFVTREEIFLLD